MEDAKIVELFWQRDERAISEFEKSYKRMCTSCAKELTGDASDAEECFSDTCLALWNSIPPQKPESLRAYGMHVCRNLALNRVRSKLAQKRSAILVELDECMTESLDDATPREIGRAIDTFLTSLPKKEAVIFMRRYYLSEPVKDIAARLEMNENKISKILMKLRKKLRQILEERGIDV